MDLAANFGWNFITVDAYYATVATSGETPLPHGGFTINDNGTPDDPDDDYIEYVKYDWDNTIKSTKEDVLSFQAKFDLNAFNVPVALTVSAKDVIETVELGVVAEVTAIENLTIKANFGYVVDTMARDAKADRDYMKDVEDVFLGQWKVGADVEYDFGFAKVAAGVNAKNLGASKAWADDWALDVDQDDTYKDVANKVILGASASISTDKIIPGAELKLAWEDADDVLGVYKYDVKDDNTCLGKITASCAISF